MRLHSDAAEEAKALNAAGDNPPAAVAAVGSRGGAPRDLKITSSSSYTPASRMETPTRRRQLQ